MNNKFFNKIILTSLCLILSFGVYKLCYFIAEKYFFDKFFYLKNTNYGYWVPNKTPRFSDFGNRSKDILKLMNDNKNILDTKQNKQLFKIAILGDSFTWGQGVKNNNRFPVLLEKELNKIKPTVIYSLANCGDNIFDNYLKYTKSPDIFGEIDLYIFALYNNDFVLNQDNRYSTNHFLSPFFKTCDGDAIYDPPFIPEFSDMNNLYEKSKIDSLDNKSKNYCIYNKILPLLPQSKAIYIDLGSLSARGNMQSLFSSIIKKDLHSISFQYSPSLKYLVSKQDGHPSVTAHKLYSDTLYKEITTNPKWGFIK